MEQGDDYRSALGRLVFVSDRTGSAATCTYDAVGSLIAISGVDSGPPPIKG